MECIKEEMDAYEIQVRSAKTGEWKKAQRMFCKDDLDALRIAYEFCIELDPDTVDGWKVENLGYMPGGILE